jgi:hypothetical protein
MYCLSSSMYCLSSNVLSVLFHWRTDNTLEDRQYIEEDRQCIVEDRQYIGGQTIHWRGQTIHFVCPLQCIVCSSMYCLSS